MLLGWLILYKSPGIQNRASGSSEYMSLTAILHSGLSGIINRIIDIFDITKAYLYYENFLLFSIFIFLSVIFTKPDFKKILYAAISVLAMIIALRVLYKIFFLFFAVAISIAFSVFYKRNKQSIYKYFLIFALLFIAEFIFIGATIQITIPKRASFQYTLINCIFIAVIMKYFYDNITYKKILLPAYIACIVASSCFFVFVMTDSIIMRIKWNNMVASIEFQIQEGKHDVIVDKNTFVSKYWNYGDWGNPDEGSEGWVNKLYADVFGADTLTAE